MVAVFICISGESTAVCVYVCVHTHTYMFLMLSEYKAQK